jgi:uncharacterized protein YyaL (SSP411 family)
VLEDARYLDAARRAADFLLATMWDGERLLRRYREGDAAIPGFLDDYAFFSQALLDLYEASFDVRYLDESVRIAVRMLELFEDTEHGGFFSTAQGDETLVMRMKEDYDGAEPSGNSIGALVLLRLSHMTGEQRFRTAAERTIDAFGSRLTQSPTAVPQMLVAAMASTIPGKQVVLAGLPKGIAPFLRELHRRFLPWHEVLAVDSDDARESLSRYNESIAGMREVQGAAAAYICENFTCNLPETDIDNFVQLLQ